MWKRVGEERDLFTVGVEEERDVAVVVVEERDLLAIICEGGDILSVWGPIFSNCGRGRPPSCSV